MPMVALALKKRQEDERKQKKSSGCIRDNGVVRYKITKKKKDDFKIFNEKGEKMWKDLEDDTSSSVAGSLVDEKIEKEFC